MFLELYLPWMCWLRIRIKKKLENSAFAQTNQIFNIDKSLKESAVTDHYLVITPSQKLNEECWVGYVNLTLFENN